MKKEEITVFAIDSKNIEYKFDIDREKVLEYYKEHGYGFLLTFTDELIELANELKAIKEVIDTLTDWQNNEWFYLDKTTYEINWLYCYNDEIISQNKSVTLPQAQKLYNNTKCKYDLLIGIIKETYRIHNKDAHDNDYCVNEFLTDVEI